jgi:hypothetical protein
VIHDPAAETATGGGLRLRVNTEEFSLMEPGTLRPG